MKRTLTLVASLLLMAGAVSVRSAEDEIDTDLMQSIEDTNRSLASHIATRNADGARADAQELDAMFGKVESFYVRKGDAADAVALAQKIRTLSTQIQQSLGTQNYTAATEAATTLARTCKTCHSFYKKS